MTAPGIGGRFLEMAQRNWNSTFHIVERDQFDSFPNPELLRLGVCKEDYERFWVVLRDCPTLHDHKCVHEPFGEAGLSFLQVSYHSADGGGSLTVALVPEQVKRATEFLLRNPRVYKAREVV